MNKPVNLDIWLSDNIAAVKATGLAKDIHIDEFIENYKKLTSKQIFDHCLSIFEKVANYLVVNPINERQIEIFLNIDLVSESKKFLGRPTDIEQLKDQLDLYTPPEIIIYKDQDGDDLSIEFYKAPLFLGTHPNIKVLYKEFRDSRTLLNEGDYTRELNLIFAP